MAEHPTQFAYAEAKPVKKPLQNEWVVRMAQRLESESPLEKRFATMLADQLQLPADSLLRRDLVDPMEYDDVVPKVQSEMVENIKDFSAAAEQICTAIRLGKTIGISADYDADGNTSLALFVRMLRACGVPAEKIIEHIPNRDQDGYGINEEAVDDFAAHHVDLMITLDNGTRAEKPIKKALDARMEVIVIDHHGDAGGKPLPAAAKVVNPNILANKNATNQSPHLEETQSLAAVGVSYMMAAEVMKRMNKKRAVDNKLDAKPLLGLVALGTVSDVVAMGWLNRVLVREGLNCIHRGEDKNILRFMRGAGIADPSKLSESDIAFRLGPIINAPGRLGDSVAWAFLSDMRGEIAKPLLEDSINHTINGLQQAVGALKPEEQKRKEASLQAWREANPDKIKAKQETPTSALYETIPENPYLDRLIESSVACNELRKDIEFLMRPEIRAEAKKQSTMPIRVIAGEGWHEGVIGIAASRVKEELGLPAVVGSIKKLEDGTWQAKFSARSIRVSGFPVDIGAAFGALGPQHKDDATSLLAKAGGHPMAAGASILAPTRKELEEKIDRFRGALNGALTDASKHMLLRNFSASLDSAKDPIVDGQERAARLTQFTALLDGELARATDTAIAQRREQIFGTLDLSSTTIDPSHGEGSYIDRLNALLDAIPHAGPFGEAMRAPIVAIRGVGVYPPETGRSESRRGHLSFDIKGDHTPLRIHCRASHAGGTALADKLHELQSGLLKGIVVGQLTRKADGGLQMEVEHVLPDKGLAADPAFGHAGVFGLVGLGRKQSARAA